MLKDYVTKVSDLPLFIKNLGDDFNSETPSGNAYLLEDGSPKLNCIKTGLLAVDGMSSAAICRITQEQLDWFLSLGSHCSILGEANESKITCEEDIKWKPYGKTNYHEIHKQDKIDIGNGEFYTPPVLHCVLG